MLSVEVSNRFSSAGLPSPLSGVSNIAWAQFVRVLSVQSISAVSASGGYGSFDLRPRRLGELGVMRNLHSERRVTRQVWTGEFVPPYSEVELLRNPLVQYRLLARSMELHDAALGALVKPEGATRSGCLAILYRGGTGALKTWPGGALKDTKELFERANTLF